MVTGGKYYFQATANDSILFIFFLLSCHVELDDGTQFDMTFNIKINIQETFVNISTTSPTTTTSTTTTTTTTSTTTTKMLGRCHNPVKGAMKDVHFVERYSYCSTEGGVKGCYVYTVDIRYLLRNQNSFEDEGECMRVCSSFSSDNVKPCNGTYH